MTGEAQSGTNAPMPKRKSRLRRKGGRQTGPLSSTSGGNVIPMTHFLPKNWLVLWGAGLFCLATVTILPILILEYSAILDGNGIPQSSASSHHGVHVLIDAAKNIRAQAEILRHGKTMSAATAGGQPNLTPAKNEIPNPIANKGQTDTKKDKTPLSLTEQQNKPHYTMVDLHPDPTDWQSKPLARGLAGRPMEETPALIGAQRAHVECDLPVDSLAYWNNPVGDRDKNYKSPFKPKLPPGKVQYITFSPDRGGWNNVRMSMEIIFVIAVATEPLYLLNKDKQAKHRGFADFFPLDKLPIEVISMKEFLERESGKLFQLPKDPEKVDVIYNAAEACDKRAKAIGPCSAIEDFLDTIGHNPGWSAVRTCLIFDQAAMESAPSDAAFAEAAEHCGEKRQPAFWNQTVAAQDILHLPAGKKDFRLLTHFYNMVFFSDPAESHYYKRFVRDYLHYHDPIYCAAGKIVQAVQLEGQSRGFTVDEEGAGGFSALHVRRGDLQYKRVKIPSVEWYENTKEVWQEKEILYVATDERNKTFFDDLAIHYDLRFLDDYWDLANLGDLDPNYMGMIDTIVASRGRAFAGTFFSTFTAYINRLRGYHGLSMKDSWYSFLPKKTHMHEWQDVRHEAYSFEWPDGWVGIDSDEWPSRDKF